MQDLIQKAIQVIKILIPSSSATPEEIKSKVEMVLLMPDFAGISRERLFEEVLAHISVQVDEFRIIEAQEKRNPWIANRKAGGLQLKFWQRYHDYLRDKKGFSETVLSGLDRLTDRILDGLFDPEPKVIIDKRGLVVGQVQSGKTSNYSGLICKAADSGYKLIIVLAGIHNNLRSQTQLRIDESVLGFDTQHGRAFNNQNQWIGVGKPIPGTIAHSLTTSEDKGDFNNRAANIAINFSTEEPILAVVKKNASVLRNLSQWLESKATSLPDGRRVIREKALLLIDDEADNASINISRTTATTINRHIRDILRLFDKSGYVGYTATPFANIFIDLGEDDLFPRDFIVNIPAPSNYIGPNKVFGFEPLAEDEERDFVLPIVRRIDDFADFVQNGHKKDDPLPTHLPESLKRAIKSFILTCAIRRVRGQKDVHNSMLIHVSRYINWQKQITTLVDNVFTVYRNAIEMNDPKILQELKDLFELDRGNEKSFVNTTKQILNSSFQKQDPGIEVHKWEEVKKELFPAATKIEVREINGGSGDALNYFDHKDGLSLIAIGGDKLSRGLTLEGLSVSYYLRASRMYDTLMQMGRWFGYRHGYSDLCRLFTSRELNEWFCHITKASEELRGEFDYMADTARATPEQFALKVRTHPGVLQISASNKIRNAVPVRISWVGRLVESYEFQTRKEILQSNLDSFKNLLMNLPETFEASGPNFLWRNISPDAVKVFLNGFRLSENLKAADPANLVQFIDLQVRNGELTQWSIALMSKRNADAETVVQLSSGEKRIGNFLRMRDEDTSNNEIYYLKKSHLISPGHEFIDLTESEFSRAMDLTRRSWELSNKKGNPNYPSGEIVRKDIRGKKRPLLLLYLLDPAGAKLPSDSPPVVGYAISFPASNFQADVEYAVNSHLLDRFNVDDTLPDDYDYEDQ
jgi:hypothetical protein